MPPPSRLAAVELGHQLPGRAALQFDGDRAGRHRVRKLSPPITIETLTTYGVSIETLDYGVAGNEWVHRVPVALGGVLDRLRQLSERLARQYGWTAAQAAVFVLTDQPPLVPPIRAVICSDSGGRARLDVDLAVTPAALAAAYRRLRRSILGPRRVKTLSEKHLCLASATAARESATSGSA